MAAVSIVIPTRDRPQQLRDSIESILAGDRLPDEIVVADQSADARASLPGRADVEIVHLPLATVGSSRARNAGIAAARGDFLVFVDDDVRAARDWLGQIVDALAASPQRTAVTGAVLSDAAGDGHVPSQTSRMTPFTFSGRLFSDPLFAGNMALRRSAFEEVGLFDERLGAGGLFPAAGDNDFGYRLLEAGYEIAFVPDAILYHRGARRGRELVRLDFAYGRGQGAFYAKHMSWSDRHMLRRLGRNVAFRLRRMPPALRGDRDALREGVYLTGLLSGTVGWLRRYGTRAGDERLPQH
ncbi:MAG TPA: glycosyltransferase [Solirubrobacteraceae bacterium]|nr:glycosyltransferase [Solirubrobacteraceae bacterium]